MAELSYPFVDSYLRGLKDYLDAIKYPEEPTEAFKMMRFSACEYYEKNDEQPRPSFQQDVLWVMYKHHQNADDKWAEFVSERI